MLTITQSDLLNIFNAKGFNTKETDLGIVVFLPEVFFEFDSAVLTQAVHDKLLISSDVLTDPRTIAKHILVEGHTDSRGDIKYNEALSLRRANAVADVLVLNGINNDRITRRGYGVKYPIAPNTTSQVLDNPEGRSQNRSVEAVLKDGCVERPYSTITAYCLGGLRTSFYEWCRGVKLTSF